MITIKNSPDLTILIWNHLECHGAPWFVDTYLRRMTRFASCVKKKLLQRFPVAAGWTCSHRNNLLSHCCATLFQKKFLLPQDDPMAIVLKDLSSKPPCCYRFNLQLQLFIGYRFFFLETFLSLQGKPAASGTNFVFIVLMPILKTTLFRLKKIETLMNVEL